MVVIDDTYKRVDCKLRGRKPKVKLEKDGKTYIFKYGAINYEIWSELIAEELGKQVGIEMAHYELAYCNGIYGVLTPNFLDKGELSIASDNLKRTATFIFEENNLSGDLKENTILNIVQSIYTFDNRVDVKKLTFELMKRWIFSMLIMESDKNETNITFIKNEKGIRLGPDYDNSSMARLNEDINKFLESVRYGYCDIHHFTDDIKNSLCLTNENNGLFWYDFEMFALKYPVQCKTILNAFSKVNVDTAIELVEKNNQIEVPWKVKFWLSKAIMIRLEDMNSIYKRLNKKYVK